MSGTVNFNPNMAQDTNGDPVNGAKAYFYDTGTTSPQTVYSDSALTLAHPVPLVADSSGNFAAIYTNGAVSTKVIVTDESDVTLPGYPVDPAVIQDAGGAASSISFSPTATISAMDVQAAIEEVDAKTVSLDAVNSANNTIYTTAGTTTAYTIVVSGVTSYASNDRYWIRVNATNTSSATLNVQNAGAKNIYKYDSSGSAAAVVAGDMVIGSEYLVHYNGTQFVVISERFSRAVDSIWATGTSVNQHVPSPANIKAAADAAIVAYPTTIAQQATTSGTSISISGIPAGVTEIHILFDQVSLSGTDNLLIQLGDSGGIETTGYVSASGTSGSDGGSTSGFHVVLANSARSAVGIMTLRLADAASFLWIGGHSVGLGVSADSNGGGRKALSAELTQLAITRTGTDTFDGGAINIIYK